MIVRLLDAVEAAELPIAVYRTAVRLARLADATGEASLSWEAYQALTGCGHVDAARRHLRQMHAAGLIEWSGGKTVVVRWTAQLLSEDAQQMSENAQLLRVDNNDEGENAQQMSENAQLLRVDDSDGAENAQLLRVDDSDGAENAQLLSENAQLLRDEEPKRAATARKQAATARSSHTRTRERALVGCLIDLSDPDNKINQPTNQTGARDEPERAERLLTEIGVAPATARRLALQGFEVVRRAVAYWQSQRKSEGGRYDNHPGIVIYWLNNPDKAGLPAELPAGWAYTELGQRYVDAPEPAPLLPEIAPSSSPADAATPEEGTGWARLVGELARSLPGNETVHQWLASSRLVDAGEVEGVPLYRVELPDPAGVGWIRDRLGPRLRREVSTMLGEKVLVEVAHG